MKRNTSLHRVALVMLISLLMMHFRIEGRPAGTQQAGDNATPSFACDRATSQVEKLIRADRNLSGLDAEYSRLYEQRVRKSSGLESSQMQSVETSRRQTRDNCVNDTFDATLIRAFEFECLASWYYARIADLKEIPSVAPNKWSPELVSTVSIYANRKSSPDLYVKKRDSDSFIHLKSGAPEPADIDPSTRYYLYRNVLGSLTYVAQNRGDGHLDLYYFFNKDGQLAAVGRRFDTKNAAGNSYVERETVFYDSAGRETQRGLAPYEKGKITLPEKTLSLPRLEKPSFNTFGAFFDSKFKAAEVLDATKLGLCYFNLADGYPIGIRVLNFEPQPLDSYRLWFRPMNYRNLDDILVNRKPLTENVQDLGTLDGKRVYSINWGGLYAILVERQSGRFLPLMYFSPQTVIDRLEIVPSVDRQIIAYSSTISGNGGFTDDWYFIMDKGVPKRVEYQTILNDELKRLFPEIQKDRPRGHFVFSQRSFNIAKLTFTSPVWKDEDPNDSPSESVSVVFEIRNARFVIKSSHREMVK